MHYLTPYWWLFVLCISTGRGNLYDCQQPIFIAPVIQAKALTYYVPQLIPDNPPFLRTTEIAAPKGKGR